MELNPSQQEAAYCFDVPVCILAGAGTGKTKTITHRIVHLIREQSVPPHRILALTFTNKAAAEMRHRIEHLLGRNTYGMELGTFHARVAAWVRRYAHLVGRTSAFTILDESDRTRLIKSLIKEAKLTGTITWQDIKQDIHLWQCEGLSPQALENMPLPEHQHISLKIYQRFIETLDQTNTTDFGHLLLLGLKLLKTEAGDELKNRIQHVVVDEYQDTSPVQVTLLEAFYPTAETIAVVGDDDQAIYGWRGAASDTMQRFIQKTAKTRLVKLEDNYRSTQTILNGANDVISVNQNRLGKSLSAQTDRTNHALEFIRAEDDHSEAEKVVHEIEGLLDDGVDPAEIAILYRKNAMSRQLETALRRSRIGYQIIGGTRFFDRAIIKDMLSVLRFLINPTNPLDLARFLKAYPQGVGQKTLTDALQTFEGDIIQGFIHISDHADSILPARTLVRVAKLGHRLQSLKRPLDEHHTSLMEISRQLFSDLGLFQKLEADIDRKDDLEDVQDFIHLIGRYEHDCEEIGETPSFIGYLEQAALLSSTDIDSSEAEVALMTIHAAKGLEFGVVFVIGLEEHQFPTSQAIEESEAGNSRTLEEERRLMYVAMTRAKDRLYLSHAIRRQHHGTYKAYPPSRFLKDIEAAPNYWNLRSWNPSGTSGPRPSGLGSRNAFVGTPRVKRRTKPIETLDELDSTFVVGDRVKHATFGMGEVTGLRGIGTRRAALVRFDDAPTRSRTIILAHLEHDSSRDSSKTDTASDYNDPQVDMSFDFGI